MKRNGSLRDVGFYVLIAILLIVSIFVLRGGMNAGDQVSYGQVRRLLEQQQVTQVELNDKTEGGCVIYSGENSQKIGDIQLVNFSETGKVIR